MKVRLFLLSADERYITKLSNAIELAYADKIELSVFTQASNACTAAGREGADILLVDEAFQDCEFSLSKMTELVYFTGSRAIGRVNGYRTVCKYQMVSEIYHDIMDIYAEKIAKTAVTLKSDGKPGRKLITFFPAAGGVGTSVAAASCARYLSARGEKVLYLNLEMSGSADLYFAAEGSFNFSRVLYALAMDGNTAGLKIEGALKQDISGVYFYSSCDTALDMLELNSVRLEQLFEKLGAISLFDWIVIDADFAFSEETYQQMERSYLTVFVTSGSEAANQKLARLLQGLEIIAQQRETLQMNRVALLYNRFSSKTGTPLTGTPYKTLGQLNRIENASTAELLQLISKSSVFEGVLS